MRKQMVRGRRFRHEAHLKRNGTNGDSSPVERRDSNMEVCHLPDDEKLSALMKDAGRERGAEVAKHVRETEGKDDGNGNNGSKG